MKNYQGSTCDKYWILLDTNNKKYLWLSLIFTVIFYRWYILFKKILLWPFKLGIWSFFYSLFGIDLSWVLNIFYIFPFNIPQWVYIQYLTLYNNWIDWWHRTVNIKKLNNVPILKSSSINETVEPESIETVEPDKYNNKKKNNYNYSCGYHHRWIRYLVLFLLWFLRY